MSAYLYSLDVCSCLAPTPFYHFLVYPLLAKFDPLGDFWPAKGRPNPKSQAEIRRILPLAIFKTQHRRVIFI